MSSGATRPVPGGETADAERRSASVPGDEQETPEISSQTCWAAGLVRIRQSGHGGCCGVGIKGSPHLQVTWQVQGP